MVRLAPVLAFAFLGSVPISPAVGYAVDPQRDFSGKWFLDARGSNTQALPNPPEQTLTVVQQDVAVPLLRDRRGWGRRAVDLSAGWHRNTSPDRR
jgi:hypothetical protein